MSADPEPNYKVADFTDKKGQASPVWVKQTLEIVKWEKREWSAGIFGCGMLFFYLTTWGGYTYLALASVLLIIHIIVSAGFNLYKAYSASEKIDNPRKPWQIEVESAKKLAESVAIEVNKVSIWYSELLSGKSLVSVVQAVSCLCVTWTLGAWMTAYTMFFLAFVGAFTLPLVYDKNQALIHQQMDRAHEVINKAIAALTSKAGKAEKSS